MWLTKSVADVSGGQAVVLGHVADELADRRALGPDVEVHDRCLAGGRLEEAEQDLDERALARAVGADEPDDPGLQLQGQAVEGGDAARVALGQVAEARRWASCRWYPARRTPDVRADDDGAGPYGQPSS